VRPRPGGFITTTVLAVLEECAGIRTFRLARPDGFDFVAGQFIAVRVQIDGRPHVRCYSISSSPDTRGYLEISVRRQGTVSTMLHATLRTGSRVAISAPAGTFVYPAADDRPLALLAAGVGITPLIAMLRYAVSSEPTRPVVLLYSARRDDEVAFATELRLIAERHPQVRITLTVTQPNTDTRWRTGRIDLPMIRQYVPHAEHTIFCICGPAAMIADTEQLLRQAGVPEGQIRFERFDTTAAAVVLNAPAPQPAAAGQGAYTIRFATSGRTVSAPASGTLLETAEADGIPIPSSCRSGVCQSCRTRVIDGAVECRSDILDPEDRAAGFILPCVSWPTGDCVLEA
jgi:ferredoxin-NADP reductase